MIVLSSLQLKFDVNLIYFKDEDKAIFLLTFLLIVMGLAGGTTLPSLTVLLSAWVPERERSKLGGFVLGGSQVLSKLVLKNYQRLQNHNLVSGSFFNMCNLN